MTTYDEALHPRATDGRFAAKSFGEQSGGLATLVEVRTLSDVLDDLDMEVDHEGTFVDEPPRDERGRPTGRGWEHQQYTVTLHYQGRTMAVPYKAGMALGEPTVKDILQACVSDARSIEGYDGDFETWGRDLGMDVDREPNLDSVEATEEDFEVARLSVDRGEYDNDEEYEDALASEAFDVAFERAKDDHECEAERAYKAIEEQDKELRALLGEHYDAVWCASELD